ncbi:MAG: Hsp20/alpha crystallin family protein [Gammaproteobacteria bacterium]|nr:Hsp20/alpha crystallin family protein [Gammaproteobacteria bacterium]
METVRYNPLGMGQLQDQINRLFSNWGDNESSSVTADWIPSVDIMELDENFQLFVDVPGVNPKDVEITLDNGVLTISGQRNIEFSVDEQQIRQHRRERGNGRFYRRFILPDTVDGEKVKATGRNGVLEVHIPKLAKAKPRRISVAA